MEALNITEHKNGTYSLNNLTFDEINFIQSALFSDFQRLTAERRQGKVLNEFCKALLDFSDKASNDLIDVMVR